MDCDFLEREQEPTKRNDSSTDVKLIDIDLQKKLPPQHERVFGIAKVKQS